MEKKVSCPLPGSLTLSLVLCFHRVRRIQENIKPKCAQIILSAFLSKRKERTKEKDKRESIDKTMHGGQLWWASS